jgi:hypothetical protein
VIKSISFFVFTSQAQGQNRQSNRKINKKTARNKKKTQIKKKDCDKKKKRENREKREMTKKQEIKILDKKM